MTTRQSYCTFFLGNTALGVQVERVQELLRPQILTPVPLVDRAVRGLINVRGQVVLAVDLRARLNLPETTAGDAAMNIVIGNGGEPVSLLVDAIGDVVEVEESQFEPPPDTIRGEARELIRGAYKLDSYLLMVIDVDRVLQLNDHARAA